MTEGVTFVAALAASFLSGLLGIGGGIVLAPLLLFGPGLVGAPDLPVKIVTGLTIVQAISGSLLGAMRHRSYGHVSRRLVVLMGPASAAGGLAGAILSGGTSDRLLLWIFASVSLVGAIMLVLPPPSQTEKTDELQVNAPLAVALAAALGILGGMVGIGGIAFIIAVLVYVLRIPARVAIGTSLAIGLFGAVAALVGKAATSQIDPELAALVAAAAVIGSPAGAWLSVRTHPRLLLVALAVVVAFAGIRIAWSAATGS